MNATYLGRLLRPSATPFSIVVWGNVGWMDYWKSWKLAGLAVSKGGNWWPEARLVASNNYSSQRVDTRTTCLVSSSVTWCFVDGSTSRWVVDMQCGQTARAERNFRYGPTKAAQSAKLCTWGGVTLCISAGCEPTGWKTVLWKRTWGLWQAPNCV